VKNFVQKGEVIDVTGPVGGLASGTPHVFGALPCIAMGDIAEGATGAAATRGVFNLTVSAANNTGNSAVSFGDRIFMDAGVLNKDDVDGTQFGVALGPVAAGATAVIPVKIG
jgi:predicted RecA/RadA family phage recombinase